MNEFQAVYQLVSMVSILHHAFVIEAPYNVTEENETIFSQF